MLVTAQLLGSRRRSRVSSDVTAYVIQTPGEASTTAAGHATGAKTDIAVL